MTITLESDVKQQYAYQHRPFSSEQKLPEFQCHWLHRTLVFDSHTVVE